MCRSSFLSLLLIVTCGSFAQAQTYFYDDAGRILRVAYPQGNGVQYSYDESDNLVQVRRLTLPAAPSGLTAVRLASDSVQLAWTDSSSNEGGFVIMRKLVGDNRWQIIGTVGPNVTSYTDSSLDPSLTYVYRISATASDTGFLSAYTNEISPADNTQLTLTVDGDSAVSDETRGSTGGTQAGYATVSVNLGNAPYGTAVFSFKQDNLVVSEAGVPASPPTKSARLFVDYRTGVTGLGSAGTLQIDTGVAVVNRGTGNANVTFTLRDLNGGIITSGNGTLAAAKHFAKFVNQLSEVAADFKLPDSFPTSTQFGSLQIDSDQPLSILALRLTINQRGETLLTSTPVADLSTAPDTKPLFFPQIADGGGYTTSVILLNTSDTTESGNLRILGDNGTPLTVRQVGGALDSSFPYTIPVGGAFVFRTDGSPAQTTAGWVQLTPGNGSPSPVGAGIFQYVQGGALVTESGVPAAKPTTKARIYVDKSSGHDTGLAIVNPNGEAIAVSLEASASAGGPTGNSSGPLSLAGGGHTARFVDQLISGLPDGFTGVLDISSDQPFAALTLRSLINGRGDYLITTFPTADLTAPAPVPIVFPQIADGGGFITQFILISAGSQANATVGFWDDDGRPLPIGKTP
jgi:YD repeat-containing protein